MDEDLHDAQVANVAKTPGAQQPNGENSSDTTSNRAANHSGGNSSGTTSNRTANHKQVGRDHGTHDHTHRKQPKERIAPEDRPFIRAENEDDDGYDPYSDRQPHAEPLFERDPWD